MTLALELERAVAEVGGAPLYLRLAETLEKLIVSGTLAPGTRLPTMRQLSRDLGISVTTVIGTYDRLSEGGWIRREIGRGTFVADRTDKGDDPAPFLQIDDRARFRLPAPWRRRALTASVSRLRAAYPAAADCTSGRPDPMLLPVDVLKRAWGRAVAQTSHAELQYAGPDPVDALSDAIIPRLGADGVPATAADLVVGSSAQQFMVLALQILELEMGSSKPVIAVEDPGYPTIFDTYERAGYGLVGVDVDADGVVPAALDAALKAGAQAALLTPRAHNPTGASWSVRRAAELADVVADHRGVLVIEDDQFAGIAATRPGSLLTDARLAGRVVYIRSFSKSMGPDLRMAIAVAHPELRRRLAEAKAFADGWSSRLAQRALAIALSDEELDDKLAVARDAYTARRAAAADALNGSLRGTGGWVTVGDDGVNIWVHLPLGVDAARVVERAAALGVLVAPGEPFFIRPGRHDVLRINAGSVVAEVAADSGRLVAEAILASGIASSDAFAV